MHAAFEDQRRPGSHARKHIDQCEECQKHLARSKWEREQEAAFLSSKEVTDLVAEYARRFRVPFWQRRRVQLTGALVLLLACVALVIFLATKNATRGADSVLFINPAVGSGGSVTPHLDRTLAGIESRLDQLFNSTGAVGVAASLNGASEQEILQTFRWIAVKRKTAMIPTLIGFLGDPRIGLRRGAVGVLLLLPLSASKPFLQSIRQAAASETNAQLRGEMEQLAVLVDKA
ncbi:MAG TPA: hypothetical protein ENK43_17735 [Planctomycetes bacterium]|nr:hypothetical protein [Planctomycetota bacterium]